MSHEAYDRAVIAIFFGGGVRLLGSFGQIARLKRIWCLTGLQKDTALYPSAISLRASISPLLSPSIHQAKSSFVPRKSLVLRGFEQLLYNGVLPARQTDS